MANLSNLFQTKQPNAMVAQLVKPSALSSASEKPEVSFHDNFVKALQTKGNASQEANALNSKPVVAEANTTHAKPTQELGGANPQKSLKITSKFGNLQQNVVKNLQNGNQTTNNMREDEFENALPDFTTEELIAKLEAFSTTGFALDIEPDALTKLSSKKLKTSDDVTEINSASNNDTLLATLQMLNAKSIETQSNSNKPNNQDPLLSASNPTRMQTEFNSADLSARNASSEASSYDRVDSDHQININAESNTIARTEMDFASITEDMAKHVGNAIEKNTSRSNLPQESAVLTAQSLQPLPASTIALQQTQSMNKDFIAPRFGTEGWNNAIQQKVVWMVGQEQQSATVTLNPPDLGPLQIVINVSNEQTDAAFFSDNQDVRQALQDGIENLRESMKEAGIQLGQANVGEHQQTPPQEARRDKNLASDASTSLATPNQVDPGVTRVSRGLLDTFA